VSVAMLTGLSPLEVRQLTMAELAAYARIRRRAERRRR
jgi:hypothetical protein